MLNKRQQSICLIQPSFLRATFINAIDILLNSCTNVEAFYLSFTQGMIPKYKCMAQFFTYIWDCMVWLSTECILNYFTIPVSVLHDFVGFWYRDEYLRTTYQKYNLYSLSTEAFIVLKIRPIRQFPCFTLINKEIIGNPITTLSTDCLHSPWIQTVWGFLSVPRTIMLHYDIM